MFAPNQGLLARLPRSAQRAVRWARLRRRRFELPVFYDPDFRLPIPGLAVQSHIDLRRADRVAWYLLDVIGIDPECIRQPKPVRFRDLLRVHGQEYLQSLLDPETLSRIFAVEAGEISVDALITTGRLACGATVQAAREALRRRRPVLSLLGGFHHASPNKAGPLCMVNDIAVAVAVARSEGFGGRIAILDMDAHPPDGLADCFAGDDRVWIGSISGSAWGALPGVDETVLPEGSGDGTYRRALEALLTRMPVCQLAFVIAGGDVLAGDHMGRLGLSTAGARRRDLQVKRALAHVPSVWLPGGGYHSQSWRVLAGTAMALARDSDEAIVPGTDPVAAHFLRVHKLLGRSVLTDSNLTMDDIGMDLGGLFAPRAPRKFLGYWTVTGIEYAMERYGLARLIERLGYHDLRVEFDLSGIGERMRILGNALGKEHVLIELICEKRIIGKKDVLFIHWLNMRHPRGAFPNRGSALPGQDAPGLGLGREAGFIIAGMARRLGLAGIAYTPSWYHVAYAGRRDFRFVDPARQGRFEAMLRDFANLPLREVTCAVANGDALLNGERYTWEAEEMALGLPVSEADRKSTRQTREASHFRLRTSD